MAFTFTVTQAVSNFTATVTNPVNLTLASNPDTVNVVRQVSTITVINTVQPVTIQAQGGGSIYNQSLNTTDNVSFASVTTPQIFGVAQQPVSFPTGISVANQGTNFQGGIDLGQLYGTFTNQVSLILALLPMDFGSPLLPGTFSINFGPI